MHAESELQMMGGVGAVDVYVVDVVAEPIRIAIGGSDAAVDDLSRIDDATAQRERLGRDAPNELVGPIPTQELLHRVGEERRVRVEQDALVRKLDQRPHARADECRRGLVPGDVQRDQLRDELVTTQPVALLLGVHELGHDVAGRMAALLLDLFDEVVLHVVHQAHAVLALH